MCRCQLVLIPKKKESKLEREWYISMDEPVELYFTGKAGPKGGPYFAEDFKYAARYRSGSEALSVLREWGMDARQEVSIHKITTI